MYPVIDPHDTLDHLIDQHPAAARVLLSRRMHCVGCAIAAFETLAEACEIYDLPLDDVLADLQAAVVADEGR